MDASERLIAKAALSRADVAVEAWKEWRATYEIATATDLLTWAGGYIYRNLNEAGIHDPYLAGIHRYNFIANNRRLVAALPVIRELTQRWDLAPLKSFGMSRETYTRGLRPLADFDFWVPGDAVAPVRAFLHERGFRPNIEVDDEEFTERILTQRGSWNFLDPEKIDLDIHWRIFDHLAIDENEKLLRDFSEIVDSEFGRILRPTDELALVVLAYHQQLEPANSATLLFDFHHLMRTVKPEGVVAVARASRMERTVGDALAHLRSVLGGDTRPEARVLERAIAPFARARPRADEVVLAPRRGEAPPPVERVFLRRPRGYRLWWRLGRPRWVERLLIGTGGLGRPGDGAASRGPRQPATTGQLSIGWHYSYPGDDFRWANAPDARVIFPDRGGADGLVVEVDPRWAIAPVEAFEVVADGRLLGTFEKLDRRRVFRLPRGSGRLEISFRIADQRRFRDPGPQSNWYRMLAPIRWVELIRLDAAPGELEA